MEAQNRILEQLLKKSASSLKAWSDSKPFHPDPDLVDSVMITRHQEIEALRAAIADRSMWERLLAENVIQYNGCVYQSREAVERLFAAIDAAKKTTP